MQTHIALSIAPPPTVAIVDGNTRVLTVLDTILPESGYSVLVLDSRTHAYRDVKRQRPTVVVLCGAFASPSCCQLLTMLKLDEDTRDIPVITLASEDDTQEEAVRQVGNHGHERRC